MDVNSQGVLYPKSQVIDYTARGDELEGYNVLSFFMDTYEAKITTKDQQEANLETTELGVETQTIGRGRLRHQRVHFRANHPKSATVQRIIRGEKHNNLPNFIGRRLPRNDDPDTYDFYCASMLLLLKPWRNLATDLKGPNETWSDSFERFLSTTPKETKAILSGIQYLHECQKATDRDIHNSLPASRANFGDEESMDIEDEYVVEDQASDDSEDTLQAIIQSQTSLGEDLHGRLAVEFAKRAKIFQNEDNHNTWSAQANSNITNATGGDVQNLLAWRTQMESDVLNINQNP